MSKRLSTGLLIAAVAVPMLGLPTMALAIDTGSADYLAKLGECVTLFLTDPSKHDAMCLPTHITADQLNSMGGFKQFTEGSTADSSISSSSFFSSSSSPSSFSSSRS